MAIMNNSELVSHGRQRAGTMQVKQNTTHITMNRQLCFIYVNGMVAFLAISSM